MDGTLSDFEDYLDINEAKISENNTVAMETIDKTTDISNSKAITPEIMSQLNQFFGPCFHRLETQLLDLKNEIKIFNRKKKYN